MFSVTFAIAWFWSGCRKTRSAKGVRSLFCFRDCFGHFLVTFSDASVTFLWLFCQTPFAGLLLRQGDLELASKSKQARNDHSHIRRNHTISRRMPFHKVANALIFRSLVFWFSLVFSNQEIPWCFECFQLFFSVFLGFLLGSKGLQKSMVFWVLFLGFYLNIKEWKIRVGVKKWGSANPRISVRPRKNSGRKLMEPEFLSNGILSISVTRASLSVTKHQVPHLATDTLLYKAQVSTQKHTKSAGIRSHAEAPWLREKMTKEDLFPEFSGFCRCCLGLWKRVTASSR